MVKLNVFFHIYYYNRILVLENIKYKAFAMWKPVFIFDILSYYINKRMKMFWGYVCLVICNRRVANLWSPMTYPWGWNLWCHGLFFKRPYLTNGAADIFFKGTNILVKSYFFFNGCLNSILLIKTTKNTSRI